MTEPSGTESMGCVSDVQSDGRTVADGGEEGKNFIFTERGRMRRWRGGEPKRGTKRRSKKGWRREREKSGGVKVERMMEGDGTTAGERADQGREKKAKKARRG